MKQTSFTNSVIILALILFASFATFSTWDPLGWRQATVSELKDGQYDFLIAFEPQTNNRSVLAYENGECGFESTKNLKRKLGSKDSYFFGIPLGPGVYTEYIHLVYVKSFEKVLCNDQTYYRAILDIGATKNACSYLKKLKSCGSDLMGRRIYRKMVNRLEVLGLGSAGDFKPKRTVKLENCNCEY